MSRQPKSSTEIVGIKDAGWFLVSPLRELSAAEVKPCGDKPLTCIETYLCWTKRYILHVLAYSVPELDQIEGWRCGGVKSH